jgi:hypothetical protein
VGDTRPGGEHPGGEGVGSVDGAVEDVGQLVAVRGLEELLRVVGAGVVPDVGVGRAVVGQVGSGQVEPRLM